MDNIVYLSFMFLFIIAIFLYSMIDLLHLIPFKIWQYVRKHDHTCGFIRPQKTHQFHSFQYASLNFIDFSLSNKWRKNQQRQYMLTDELIKANIVVNQSRVSTKWTSKKNQQNEPAMLNGSSRKGKLFGWNIYHLLIFNITHKYEISSGLNKWMNLLENSIILSVLNFTKQS